MLDFPSGEQWAVEAKWSRVLRTTKGFHLAREALAPDRCFLVGTGPDRYPVTDTVEAISLRELAGELHTRGSSIPASCRTEPSLALFSPLDRAMHW